VENSSKLHLSLKGEKEFVGYLIKLHDDRGVLGDLGVGAKFKNCYGREKTSSIQHSSKAGQKELNFSWTAPEKGSGTAKVRAFVLTSMREWYPNSDVIEFKVKP